MKRFLTVCVLFVIAQSCFCLNVEKVSTMKCGTQPKQVLFSPDNKCLVLPLLEDKGFHVIDLENPSSKPKLIKPPASEKEGYVEGLFIPEKNAFFISQMTTGKIYEYSYPGFEYKREIDTKGTWSKFIAWNPAKSMLAVSNWVSNDVSLIDYESGILLKKIKTAAAPRGLAFVNDGKEMIVLCFDGGEIQKFNVSTGAKIDSVSVQKSAMRHIVMNSFQSKAYISDMYHACVYEFDLFAFKITATWKVFTNPNTIDLLDDRYLFVSCRGPNNRTDYTKRSPANGKIYVIDVKDGSTVCKIDGGNQPTGLALSSDGTSLCFTNFQDANCEMYKIVK